MPKLLIAVAANDKVKADAILVGAKWDAIGKDGVFTHWLTSADVDSGKFLTLYKSCESVICFGDDKQRTRDKIALRGFAKVDAPAEAETPKPQGKPAPVVEPPAEPVAEKPKPKVEPQIVKPNWRERIKKK